MVVDDTVELVLWGVAGLLAVVVVYGFLFRAAAGFTLGAAAVALLVVVAVAVARRRRGRPQE